MFRIALKTCADLEGGQGLPTTPLPLENHNAIGFVSIPGKLKMLDHHRLASVHFKWYLDALSTHQLKKLSRVGPPLTPFLDPRMEATILRSNHNIIHMGEISKIPYPELKEIQILKHAGF